LGAGPSPWDRTTPLHVTSSALVVHPASGRVLLRWHERQQAWLQIGGHGDPGEDDPLEVALREGREETGLTDLQPWPDDALRHVVVVPVPATERDRAHEHADLRFFLSTGQPDAARPERPGADLRWLSVPAALELAAEANVRETIRRAAGLFPAAG
jgi:8-oxo-dGTP pyrophosphatase MutT (NUDIX family)